MPDPPREVTVRRAGGEPDGNGGLLLECESSRV